MLPPVRLGPACKVDDYSMLTRQAVYPIHGAGTFTELSLSSSAPLRDAF